MGKRRVTSTPLLCLIARVPLRLLFTARVEDKVDHERMVLAAGGVGPRCVVTLRRRGSFFFGT